MTHTFARGERASDYTDHQRWLVERLYVAMPEITDDIETACAADEAIFVTFQDDGSGPTGAALVRRIPRADLVGLGEPRFDAPAPTKPGETSAVWVVAKEEDVPGTVCLRLGRYSLGTGGDA